MTSARAGLPSKAHTALSAERRMYRRRTSAVGSKACASPGASDERRSTVMPRIIDLSMVTESDPSPLMNVTITHLDHENGAREDQKYYDIDPDDWPHPGKSYADDFVEMTTHAGTHMDAPYHMGPL